MPEKRAGMKKWNAWVSRLLAAKDLRVRIPTMPPTYSEMIAPTVPR